MEGGESENIFYEDDEETLVRIAAGKGRNSGGTCPRKIV